MKFQSAYGSLIKAFEDFKIVDAHEHLQPESVRVSQGADVFTLFSHYTRVSLLASGMTMEQYNTILNRKVALEKRWALLSPHLNRIRYTSFARAIFIAAKEIYGFDDINDNNYKDLSKKISDENKPGIYNRILREKSKIETALVQIETPTEYDIEYFKFLLPLDTFCGIRSKESVERQALNLNMKVESLDDYIELMRKGFKKWKSDGIVGVKMRPFPYKNPERSEAIAFFKDMMKVEKRNISNIDTPRLFPERKKSDLDIMTTPLYPYLFDEAMEIIADLGMVAAVHTGMWGDFTIIAPRNLIPILTRHPRTRFDIFHLGLPYARETAILGISFPNAWINFCWAHVISSKITCLTMEELIDLVPTNKVIAFGGDYRIPVEKVYGHLVLAKENVARVLARRIDEKLMSEEEAINLAKKWFYDNPKELYNLK